MRQLRLLSILFLVFSSTPGLTQVAITEIDENYTQVDFGFHIMMVHFNIRPANEDFRPLTGGFEITDQDRRKYVTMIGEEVLKLPPTIVTRYVIDNVFILAIKQENTLGYHSDDLIVIEGRESDYQMRRTLFHEIAHEITAKSSHKNEFKDLCHYLDAQRSNANALSYLRILKLYETGHTTAYAQKSAEEEFCELFADLMVPHAEAPLIRYVIDHPQSILAGKVSRLLAFLAGNHAGELNQKFFLNLNSPYRNNNKVIAKGY